MLSPAKGAPNACVKHAGPARLVFQTRSTKVYAGSHLQQTHLPGGATIVDLAGQYRPTVRSTFPVPGLKPPRILDILWPDMATPNLTADNWRAIAAELKKHKVVYVACQGGHGRTGTALAVLGHFLKAYPGKQTDPVAHIRTAYCPEAVETESQLAYITAITGRKTKAKPSQKPWLTVGAGTGKVITSLCPLKDHTGKWCNRDNGHAGACDTRPRWEIEGSGPGPGLGSAKPGAPAWPESPAKIGPTLSAFCQLHQECLGLKNHKGACPIHLEEYGNGK